MNYLAQSFLFKVKKVLRYIRLYGLRNTYEKVLGQKHLHRIYNVLPPKTGEMKSRHKVGLIGCGNHAYSVIAYYLRKEFGNIIAACMDKDINRAASLAERYKVPLYTDNPVEVLQCKNTEMIYIASNHASHAEYAIRALEYGKDVFIEKPHVVSIDQLHRLHKAMLSSEGKIFLGFNRPHSRFGKLIAQKLNENPAPAIFNWFVIGHFLEKDHWYHNPGEGGRVLGNLCHWSDHVLRLAGSPKFPITIIPARWEKSDQDIAVSLVFANGTVGSITFASQGYSFEGIRESFRAQKGNIIFFMDDFQKLTIEEGSAKKVYSNFYREQGHKAVVAGAYRNVRFNEAYYRTEEVSHILNTAWLFLNIREALEKNTQLIIRSYEDEFANIYSANIRKESAGVVFENASG